MSHEPATTVAALQRAKDDGDVRLRVVLGNDEALTEQVKVLETFSSNLCSVSLVGCDIRRGEGWKVPDLRAVLSVLQALSSLVHIQFENSNVNGWTLSATAVTEFLRTTRLRLETLEFTAVRLEGTREELKTLGETMKEMVCLRSCCLQNNFLLWVSNDRVVYPLDGFLQALAQLPLLQDVYIDLDHWNDEAHQTQLTSSSETLSAVLNSPSIQDVFLGKIDPTNPVLHDIGNAMTNSNNTSHIRFLSLQFRPIPPADQNDTPTAQIPHSNTPIATCLSPLTRALRVNTTLKEFRLCFGSDHCPSLDDFLFQVAEELSHNPQTQLQKFEVIAPCSYGAAVEQAFVQLLRTNYSLIELDFYSTMSDKYFSLDASHRTEMHLYMSLNADGRGKLLQTYNRRTWVEALAQQSHHLDALYYYLHMNPWLMSDRRYLGKNRTRNTHTSTTKSRKRKHTEPDETTSRKMRRLQDELEWLRQENTRLQAKQQPRPQQQQQKQDTAMFSGCVVM